MAIYKITNLLNEKIYTDKLNSRLNNIQELIRYSVRQWNNADWKVLRLKLLKDAKFKMNLMSVESFFGSLDGTTFSNKNETGKWFFWGIEDYLLDRDNFSQDTSLSDKQKNLLKDFDSLNADGRNTYGLYLTLRTLYIQRI